MSSVAKELLEQRGNWDRSKACPAKMRSRVERLIVANRSWLVRQAVRFLEQVVTVSRKVSWSCFLIMLDANYVGHYESEMITSFKCGHSERRSVHHAASCIHTSRCSRVIDCEYADNVVTREIRSNYPIEPR